MSSRGTLIVFEGGDRAGKSTQAGMLVSALERALGPESVRLLKFPDRTTPIGRLIDRHLRGEETVADPKALHLLFAANRWELATEIRTQLERGTTLVVDRYAYSGVAYSAARGLGRDWCRSADEGLPSADVVFFMQLAPEQAAARPGFGAERYETEGFQASVAKEFVDLERCWADFVRVDAGGTKEAIHATILEEALKIIACPKKDTGRAAFKCHLWYNKMLE